MAVANACACTTLESARPPRGRSLERKAGADSQEPPASAWAPPAAPVSAWREQEFEAWLERTLAAERSGFASKLQLALSKHHKVLLEEVEGALEASVSEQLSSPRDLTSRACSPFEAKECFLYAPANGDSEREHSEPLATKAETEKTYKTEYVAELALEYKKPTSCVEAIVNSHVFEFGTCGLIFINMFCMALEVQYSGCFVAQQIEHPDCGLDVQRNPMIETMFTAMSVAFSCCFTGELILRALHLRWDACCSMWMWFDVVVLGFGFVDTLGRLGTTPDLVLNPTAMRAARIVRMLRMLKVFKARESFHMLFLLMKSILASRHALVWSVLILYFTMTCVGLLMNQLIYSFLLDTSADEDDRREVYEYFGTYTRMLITMFEITLGNWAPPARMLMTNVSQWWGVFIVVYRCMLCFSLVHVTAAVFITETSRVAQDDEVNMMRKQNKDRKTQAILSDLFAEIDTSSDGSITMEELRMATQDPVLKNILEILGLEVVDIEELFSLMENSKGKVERADFADGIMKLRGLAKSSKQFAMMRVMQSVEAQVTEVQKALTALSASAAAAKPRQRPRPRKAAEG